MTARSLFRTPSHAITIPGLVLFTIVTTASNVQAGVIPDVFMNIEVRDTAQTTLFDSGSTNLQTIGINTLAGEFYNDPVNSFPALQDPLFSSTGFVIARPQPGGGQPATLNSNLTFVNESTQTLEFIVDLTLSLPSALGGPHNWTADSTWELGGDNPAVNPLIDYQMFTAIIDGSPVGTQNAAGGLSLANLNFDGTDLSGNVAAVNTELTLRLAFSLTAGDTLGLQSFINVPTPAATSLLLISGICTRRRRRN